MIYTNDVLSLILFQPITAWLVSIAAPFLALSILMILHDKCQMKSFENINILIKIIEKNMLSKKNLKTCFSKKNKKKLLFWKKNFLKTSLCLKNNFFRKKIFTSQHIKVREPKSPGV